MSPGFTFKCQVFWDLCDFHPLGTPPEWPGPPTNQLHLPTVVQCGRDNGGSQQLISSAEIKSLKSLDTPQEGNLGSRYVISWTGGTWTFHLGSGTSSSLGPKGIPWSKEGGHLSGLNDWSTQGPCGWKTNALDISWLWSKSSKALFYQGRPQLSLGAVISNDFRRKKK